MVVYAKKNGQPRCTVDFQALNVRVCEIHHTQYPFQQARSFLPGKHSNLDDWNEYHSVSMHNNDHHFTTFITPWGRYRYSIVSQGSFVSGNEYTH